MSKLHNALPSPQKAATFAMIGLAALLSACGGGGGGSSSPTGGTGSTAAASGVTVSTSDESNPTIAPTAKITSYTVSGTVSGLSTGSSVALMLNGTETVTVAADGSYAFTTALKPTDSYTVTVANQPTTEICTLVQATGFSANANVANVAVTCKPTYRVAGKVSGLMSGEILTLQVNAGETVTLTGDPSVATPTFRFPTALVTGSPYEVTLKTSPELQSCTLTDGKGILDGADAAVSVSCSTNTFSIGGSASAVAVTVGNSTTKVSASAAATVSKASFSLTNTTDAGTDVYPLNVDDSGPVSFTFPKSVDAGSSYAVALSGVPATHVCTVTNAAGTVRTAKVSNVGIACSVPTWTVGGTVTGLPSGSTVVLSGSNGDTKTITGTGSSVAFTMGTPLANTAPYAISVSSQPSSAGTTCVVSNGSGSMSPSNITNVAVTCATYKQFAYVVSKDVDQISMFALDPTTGAPASLGTIATPDTAGLSNLVAHPNGKYLYASLYNSVQAYAVGASGALTPIGSNITTNGLEQPGITINPAGTLLYVAGRYAGNVTAFSIDPSTGALYMIGSYPGFKQPRDLSVSPDGKFLYVANFGDACDPYDPTSNPTGSSTVAALLCPSGTNPNQHIDVLAINGSGGLSWISSATNTDVGTYAIVATPSYVFTTAFGGNTMTTWLRNPTTGALTSAGSSPTLPGPIALTVNPASTKVYVSDYSQVLLKYGGWASGNAISQYAMGSPAALVDTVSANQGVRALKFDSTGQHAYSIGGLDSTLRYWSVSGDALYAQGSALKLPGVPWGLAVVNKAN